MRLQHKVYLTSELSTLRWR